MSNIKNFSIKKTLPSVIALSAMAASCAAAAIQLEEVVVTAQKREQNLQDVAISVSAVTERGLEKAGISTTDDLSVAVPGLNVTRQLSSFAPILRGIGNYIAAPGAEGAIATYVDGIYLPSAYGSVMSLANVERVEVLRGPQGTLFGRNATGGLIHVITKTPDQEFSGKFGVSYGSQDTVESKFYVTGGLSETVAADLGVFVREQGDGFGENVVNGSDAGFRDELAIKSKMLIDVTDTTQITLMADYADSETDSGLNRVPVEGTTNLIGEPPQPDFHDVAHARDHFSENDTWGVAGKIDTTFDSFDLLAMLSYRETDAEFSVDQSESSVTFADINLPTESETLTAEVQIKSNGAGPIQWIGGIYFFDDTAGVYPFDITGPGAGLPPGVTNLQFFNEQESQSISIFGETNIELTDATKLTIGARLTQDERDYSHRTVLVPAPGQVAAVEDSEDWEEPSWRISLDHQVTEDVMVYGSYSRGFKSGIYNLFGGPIAPVDPEILDAYEIGFKSELMDGRVRLNGAAYYYEYDDLQLSYQIQGASVVINAANAEIKGVDLELQAALTDTIELNANLGWNDSEFIDFPTAEITTRRGTGNCPANNPTPNCSVTGNAKGNTLPRAPELTANVGLSYEKELEGSSVGANINIYYNDGFYNEFANREDYKQDSYTLLNGGAFVEFGDARQWRASLYFRNLTDEEYYVYGTATALGDYISPAFGRQYGVGLDYSF
ncbi:TonB-dependent receptor [Acinetobacter sp.]|uniref:TonB-dependent receptor n=1 Tax=Acinetobacter sp. TaxID=472 RepID=UPI003D08FE04